MPTQRPLASVRCQSRSTEMRSGSGSRASASGLSSGRRCSARKVRSSSRNSSRASAMMLLLPALVLLVTLAGALFFLAALGALGARRVGGGLVERGEEVALEQPEADLELDLDLRVAVVAHEPADRRDLEPVEVAQRPRGLRERVADGLLDRVVGDPDDLHHLV